MKVHFLGERYVNIHWKYHVCVSEYISGNITTLRSKIINFKKINFSNRMSRCIIGGRKCKSDKRRIPSTLEIDSHRKKDNDRICKSHLNKICQVQKKKGSIIQKVKVIERNGKYLSSLTFQHILRSFWI